MDQPSARPHTCCNKQPVIRGMWTPEEDEKLKSFMLSHVPRSHSWTDIPLLAGLQRCGKSCRIRWTNHLRPDLKGGYITEQEANLIHHLHNTLGNRWAEIAGQLPGRSPSDVKNYWYSTLKKKNKHSSSSSSADITTSIYPQHNYQVGNPDYYYNPQFFTPTVPFSNYPVMMNFETGDFSPMPLPPKPPVIIDVDDDDEEDNVDVKITPTPEVNAEMRQGFSEPASMEAATIDGAGISLELVVPEHNFPDDITYVEPLEMPPPPPPNFSSPPAPAPRDWTFFGGNTSYIPTDYSDWGLD